MWLVNGEFDALTQCLSRLSDAPLGFQWNTNVEVCVFSVLGRWRRTTKQSRQCNEVCKAPWQHTCAFVCVHKRNKHTPSPDTSTYITKDYSCLRSCGLMGQTFPEQRRDFPLIQRLVVFKFNNTFSNLHINILSYSTRLCLILRTQQLSFDPKRADPGAPQHITWPYVPLIGDIWR